MPDAAHYGFGQGAQGGTRTHNLRFTKPLLCRLSYLGVVRLRGYLGDRHDARDDEAEPPERMALGYAWLRMNAMKFCSSCSLMLGKAGMPLPPCMACSRIRESGRFSMVRFLNSGPIPPLRSVP